MSHGNVHGDAVRILFVDDDPDTVRIMARLLAGEGYLISTASTLADAKRLCAANKFELLITDLSLPDGSGSDLLTEIRESCPVKGIIISGHDQQEHEALGIGISGGFSDYLVKPVLYDELISAVRRVLAETA